VRTTRAGLATALVAQTALLAVLAGATGLRVPGVLAGLAYAGAGTALVHHGMRRTGRTALGPADLVTLARAVLVGGVLALVAEATAPAVMAALAGVALVLDGVDGRVARRTGTVSDFGARFDVEVDSVLVLVLSVAAAEVLGGWVVLLGLPYYLLLAARRAWPWLRRPTPPRRWCKVVAVVQGVVLTAVAADVLPAAAAIAALATVAALLVESFGREVAWLWRAERGAPETAVLERAGA
jgi:phosphatidylglycerophosphate synthase